MIYSNLLYLLIIIFVFSTSIPPQEPRLTVLATFILFTGKGLLFYLASRRSYGAGRIKSDRQYFSIERKLTIVAIILFTTDIYLLDCKYYLQFLAVDGRFPSLLNLAGIALFFCYLSLIWLPARKHYAALFDKHYSPSRFVTHNIKLILPFILPWLIILFIFDLTSLLFPGYTNNLPWLENVLILLFFILMIATFPALIRRLWNCTPLSEGPLRHKIETFCHEQNFKYTDIMLWPLYEGRVLTAGVMGIFPQLRYLLITPALLNNLDSDEIEAVMAHEIGHIKKYHLYLYLLIIMELSVLLTALSNPINLMLLQSDLFYKLVENTAREPFELLMLWGSAPIFLIMIIYFRYIFGFFMRNFERQADLHVFKALGDITPLISSFEKIAWLSGDIRDQPSWHHFGIGQRVDFLLRCKKEPILIKKHDRKVYSWLMVYFLVMALSVSWLWSTPDLLSVATSNSRFLESVYSHKAMTEPNHPLWHHILGNIQVENNKTREAIISYQKALNIDPENIENLNNLAWLLVTATDTSLRNPKYGLELALQAAQLQPDAHILDTLAEAYWLNGFSDRAIATEQQALNKDPINQDYYLQQIDKFQNSKLQRFYPVELATPGG